MPEQVTSGIEALRTVKSGAVSANADFYVSLMDNDSLRFLSPADSVTVTAPKKTDGTHANLTITVNGASDRTTVAFGGGGRVTLFGPIYSVKVTPDATVAGSGLDDIELVFTGRDQVGANRGR